MGAWRRETRAAGDLQGVSSPSARRRRAAARRGPRARPRSSRSRRARWPGRRSPTAPRLCRTAATGSQLDLGRRRTPAPAMRRRRACIHVRAVDGAPIRRSPTPDDCIGWSVDVRPVARVGLGVAVRRAAALTRRTLRARRAWRAERDAPCDRGYRYRGRSCARAVRADDGAGASHGRAAGCGSASWQQGGQRARSSAPDHRRARVSATAAAGE